MADEQNSFKLFGFEISRTKETKQEKKLSPSVVPPTDADGPGYVSSGAGHYGQYLNMDGADAKDNVQLITRYRGVSMNPEVDMAIEEIVNESIVTSESESSIKIKLDNVEISKSIKKQIEEEFKNVVSLLKFNDMGHDIFRSWYIDGRVVHHLLVNEKDVKKGIQEIRHIDSTKIRKVRDVKYKKDPKTNVKVVDKTDEYYIYEEKPGSNATASVRISTDAISYVTSGQTDETRKKVISHLHKALKPINQLRMMEDSLVIYRLARAPERRIFYIDIGNLPRGKADQYMKDIMAKYRNKLVYDANTGQLKDDRKHMSMLEDFWLPRRENGRGTEISTLPGGDNLGQIEDIIYFQKRLYRSLNVPVNRLEQEAQFSLGRSTEISRDEVKFQKFVDRLRRRFGTLFLNLLKKQLILKGIITEQDWEDWKDSIYVDYLKDNHFTELKDAEVLQNRLGLLNEVSQYVGDYFSKDYVMKNILQFTDEEVEKMNKQINKETDDGEIPEPPEEDEEEKSPAAAAPESPTVNVNVNGNDVKTDKKEKYIPSNEDELTEELTRYMARINEQG
ncbi:portal protein [bacterium]|nr:portal protein [bacterium]